MPISSDSTCPTKSSEGPVYQQSEMGVDYDKVFPVLHNDPLIRGNLQAREICSNVSLNERSMVSESAG